MHADETNHDPSRLIAVVGMAGRFPGAPDTESLWRLLTERGNGIRPVPATRWDAGAQLDAEKKIQDVGGFIDGVDEFDPAFFGISPREVEDIDPQQRLVLETGFRTLEDAGTRVEDMRGTRTGVYVGALWHDYELLRKDNGGGATQRSAVGQAIDVISARLSYFLGAGGPSLTVATGCSSSLVALHLAAQALLAGEIDGALVSGVNLILTPDVSIGLTHFGGLSPDGRCAAFGAGANGFVRGEGVASVYLKTLDRARADGDRVHAVIVRTDVNNDGGGDSLVTPNTAAQEDLLRRAYADAGVPLDKLAYVEAHGTGTRRGDPVEAGAIGRALGQRRDSARPLAIGSVKSNIGHLEAASGMAGLFKAVLSLKHRVVPPSLHAEELSPYIPFDELNLQVVREPLPLPKDGPLYMGVNSFGWGGTNAHAVLMSAPDTDPAPAVSAEGRPVLVPLSGHTHEALRQRASDIRDSALRDEMTPAVLADTLGLRRDSFALRAGVVARTNAELAEKLGAFAEDPEAEIDGLVTGRARRHGRTAFVFPGQGSQWAGMGRELYASSPVFAAVVGRCARALAPHTDWDLTAVVSGAAGDGWLERLDMIQPTLWAVSVGIAELWREAGVEPDVVVGHSQGEVTAATVAGILSYEDAALIIARRSAIAGKLSGRGRMLAVDLDATAARKALEGFEEVVSLAVSNGPTSSVLSGDTDAVLTLKEILEAEGTFCRLVNVDYASHSPQMDELREELAEALAPVRPRRGTTPLMSTVRVTGLSGPEMDTGYWVDNLRSPVLFADALGAVLDDGVTHVVEISPHPILAPAIEQLGSLREEQPAVLTSLRRDTGSPADFTAALARGFALGLAPFGKLGRGVPVSVPGYPWQRSAYWLPAGKRRTGAGALVLAPAVSEQDAWQGEVETGLDASPWLADHKVDDAVVLPGAAMLGYVLDAARSRHGTLPARVSAVEFRSDLTLGEEPARLSVLWRDDVTEGGSCTLLSLPPGATRWTRHAVARVQWGTGEQAADGVDVAFPDALTGLPAGSAEDFYAACAARGLPYGPAFQGVRTLRLTDGEALAEVALAERCRAGARSGTLHPALWDGALQVCLALAPEGVTVVPTEVGGIDFHDGLREPVTELWSYAVRRSAELYDLHLFTAGRTPLLTMSGLRMRPLATTGADDGDDGRAYVLDFVESAPPEPSGAPGNWLVCGEPALTAGLAEALTEAGATAAVAAGEDPAGWAAEAARTAHLTGVALAAPSAATGLPAQRRLLAALPGLVRSVTALPSVPRLVLVTAGGQAVVDGESPDPGAALFWGFGRVLRREHPELSTLLLDVRPAEDGWAAGAAAELPADDGEDQVVLRRGRRLTGRLTPAAALETPDAADTADGADGGGGRAAWRPSGQPFRLVQARPGLWGGLEHRPLARRAPGRGEIEVRVTAAGLNFIDVMKAMGTYPDPTGAASLLGGECAGRVVAVGEGVAGFAAGDRVAACAMGSLASHVTVRADHVQHVPGHLTDADAAGLPLSLSTAWYGLRELGRLAEGETVLIHSAAGGLGLAAVQVARALGARILATAGSEDKRRHLRDLGVEHVFDSRSLAWAGEVRAATGGRGVDVVLNSLTGAAIPLGLEALAEDGRFVEVGKKDIYADRNISLSAFRKSISFAAVDLAGLLDRRPRTFARIFADAWRGVTPDGLRPLPRLDRDFADAAEALREMSRGTHIGKFVLGAPDEVRTVVPEPLTDGRFRADGSYLITGGLGGLGLSLAGFLVDRGAGALALLGRSEPGSRAARRIAAWRERGVRVHTYAVDVSDETALRTTLSLVREELPPLRGVVHAAGVLDDATIRSVTPEQIERVLAPKVDGARHLDAATADETLDFFLMFSSVASLIGNTGQAGYAAGNAYLDALAVARRAAGRPGLAVQWGPFAEIGLAARDDVRGARLGDRGMESFPAQEAWAALVRFLEQDRQVVGYVPLNLRQWFDAYPETAAQKTWELLRRAGRSGAPGTGAEGAFLTRYSTASEDERMDLVEARVRENVGRVLRLDPKNIDHDVPFKALGLDSLMSLELRNRLEAAFGLKLSPTLLWTYGNTRALSGALSDRIQQTVASAA